MDYLLTSPFCRELVGAEDNHFRLAYGDDPPSRFLYESDHFVVLCDFAPLVLGHLLIIPKEPLLSFAHVPQEQWAELLALKSLVKKVVSATYSSPIIVEHGSSSTMTGGGCISHAHWHVVPLAVDFLGSFESEQFTVTPIEKESDIVTWRALDIPYLYFESVRDKKFVAEDIEFLRRQYIRIEIAKHLNIEPPYWDWRVFANKELLRSTIKKLTSIPWENT